MKELKNFLEKGVVSNIASINRNMKIHGMIFINGRNIINAADGEYNRAFGLLQQLLYKDILILTAILFEKSNSRYPNRSIKTLIDKIKAEYLGCEEIAERYQFEIQLQKLLNEDTRFNKVKKLDDKELLALTFDEISSDFESNSFEAQLNKIKDARDKKIAHQEIIDIENWPKMGDVSNLLDYAKNVVGLIGWAFLNTAYTTEQGYTLDKQLNLVEVSFREILNGLGVND